MHKMGTVRVVSRESIVFLRERILFLAVNLGIDRIKAQRTASAVSEICRQVDLDQNNLEITAFV